MSKKKHSELARKKHQKAVKRKNKARKVVMAATAEERLQARIRSAIQQPRTRAYKEIPLETLLAEARERIKDLRFIHYYLIFAKILCDKGLIPGTLNYDVTKMTFVLKGINESINIIPKLEEENAVQVELYDTGEKMNAMSAEMNKFILLLEPYQIYISNSIMKIGEKLPPKEDGTAYENWEIENEVLKTYAIEYIAEHVYKLNAVEGSVNE